MFSFGKTIAAAAVALAVVAPAQALAATSITNTATLTDDGVTKSTTTPMNLTGGLYSFVLNLGSSGSLDSTATAWLKNLTTGTTVGKLMFGLVEGETSGSTSSMFNLATGSYTVSLLAGSSGTGTLTATASVQAVPGPIAGAGLPMLAGLVAYGFHRRRKTVAAV